MYLKIALRNVRKNISDYIIYFLTLAFSVCVFYSFSSLSSQKIISVMDGSGLTIVKTIIDMISYMSILVFLIFGGLILYANNFLIKKRNKEFAIYKTLGMGRWKISRILVFETLIVGLVSVITGLVLGILASQGFSILILNIFKVEMSEYSFIISSSAVSKTVFYFVFIFFIVMIFNVAVVSKYNIKDLLLMNRKNEDVKSEKVSRYIFVFTFSILSFCYVYNNLLTQNIDVASIKFLVIMFLALTGTFSFFYSIAAIILCIAKGRRKFYFKGINIFIIQQIKSKVRTNFISISFMAIVIFISIISLSTGISVKISMEKNLEQNTPYDASESTTFVDGIEDNKDIVVNNDLGEEYAVLKRYTKGINVSQYIDIDYDMGVSFLKLSEYNANRKLKNKGTIELNENEVYITSGYKEKEEEINKFIKNNGFINIDGRDYKIKNDKIDSENLATDSLCENIFSIVVNDSICENDKVRSIIINMNYPEDKKDQCEEKYLSGTNLSNVFNSKNSIIYTRNVQYKKYGVLTVAFLIVFIYVGIIFLIASMGALAIQQLSEASDSIHRYKALKNLFVTDKDINKAIFKQVFLYYALPIGFALVNSVIIIKRILYLIITYNIVDVMNSAFITMFFLIVVYALYFFVTYGVYKKVIKDRI